MSHFRMMMCATLALLAATSIASAEDSGATQPCVIDQVTGIAQYRLRADDPWKKAEEGVELPTTAEIRTGPKTVVILRVGQQKRVVGRLGLTKVADVIAERELKLTYGRTRYDVEAEGVEHESTIRSPSTVLAIRCRLRVVLVEDEQNWVVRLWREMKEGIESWGR